MAPDAKVRSGTVLLILIYLGFVSLGLPDGAFGVAWPAIYPELGLPVGTAGTLTLIGTGLTALSAFNSARIIARIGTGRLVAASCAITGSALLLLSLATGYPGLVGATVLLSLGAGAVDSGLNAFVARHYSGRHMNWLHACWGLGATCGPLLMGLALAGTAGWRGGYVALGSAQAVITVMLLLTLRLWSGVPERKSDSDPAGRQGSPPTKVAASPEGFLSAAIFALYVGVEATTGVWAATVLVVDRAIPKSVAGVCAACFFGSIMIGRVITGVVVDRKGNRAIVRWGVLLSLIGTVAFATASSLWLSAAALLLVGLGFSPVYPCLMHEVPRRFAAEAVQTVIGRQSGASSIGWAVFPAAAGLIAEWKVSAIPWLVVAGVLLLIVAIRELDRRT